MARGHITKRSEGSWSLVVELERDPATGKRRQKWETFRGKKTDAKSGSRN
jgi:integrase